MVYIGAKQYQNRVNNFGATYHVGHALDWEVRSNEPHNALYTPFLALPISPQIPYPENKMKIRIEIMRVVDILACRTSLFIFQANEKIQMRFQDLLNDSEKCHRNWMLRLWIPKKHMMMIREVH